MENAVVTIRSINWQVKVANSPTELSLGLSGVESLPAGEGMLFDLGITRKVSVNALEMLFPLNIVFISEDLKVTELLWGLQPGEQYTTGLPCRFFLEINEDEGLDIEVGDEVIFEGYSFSLQQTASLFSDSMMFLGVGIAIMAMVKIVNKLSRG